MKKLLVLLVLLFSFSVSFAQGVFKYEQKVRFEYNSEKESFDMKEIQYELGYENYPIVKNCVLYDVIDPKGKVPIYCYVETFRENGLKRERKVFCFYEGNVMTAIGFMKDYSNVVTMYRIVN